ncbi:GAF domain-containing protein [Amycolatopsis rhabdoformis]|uniref:GAF domain-containing protein n=1 Tax=Amycolatopsis rhabdoformis TaxID=1448059 RepID=A0ABZ1IFE5_9PSEU|nr:GAF domain-containing protein [Amycolatopsis rhabdoformis]WSE32423.1 GAF domain-containing protein [Amycolatopsis rhabdoformis]
MATERDLHAMSRVSATLAGSGSLADTLTALAGEVRRSAGLAAVHIQLGETGWSTLPIGALSGLPGTAAELRDRLDQCQALGAEMVSLSAIAERRPVVVAHRSETFRTHPAWAPISAIHQAISWESFVAAPLILPGGVLGYLSAFYPPGREPDPDEISFLSAVADQAAVTIDHAGMIVDNRARAVREERRKLAADLHDSIVQEMFSLSMHARAIELTNETSGAGAAAKIRADAARVVDLSQSVVKSFRSMIAEWRAPEPAERSLVTAIREWVAAASRDTGLTVKVVDEVGEIELLPEQREEVWYLVREAFHNVVKHARAQHAVIRFAQHREESRTLLVVETSDDGVGFAERGSLPGHVGLVSMSERAARLGGRLAIVTRPGGGTVVRLEFCPGEPAGSLSADGTVRIDWQEPCDTTGEQP